MKIEGKALDCDDPPAPGYTPSRVSCAYWPKDIVLGKTRVTVRYFDRVRPDIARRVRVAFSIDRVTRKDGK